MRAAVLGSPIAHSMSPTIHRAGYAALGLDHDYQAIEVSSGQLRSFVAGLTTCWMGLSLTMPLKEEAFQVAAQISPLATLAGSINTLLIGDTIRADNTDIYGICTAVREATQTSLTRLTVIGSGATARSALVAGALLGVETATVVARNIETRERCHRLAARLGMHLSEDDEPTIVLTSDTLVINTIPAQASADVVPRISTPDGVLLDVVYHPWPSPLAALWNARGLLAIPGHLMLLHQAARQFEMMTGENAPLEVMREALQSAIPA